MNPPASGKPDTGPPKDARQAPGRSQPRQAQHHGLSRTEAYHKPSHTPRGLAAVAFALPTHAWRQLRKEAFS